MIHESTTITLQNYSSMVAKFCSELPLDLHNVHMSLGIADEFMELLAAINNNDIPNIIEECGDICWYVSQYCRVNGLSFEEILSKEIAENKMHFEAGDSGIINITKAQIAKYNKTFTKEDIIKALRVNLQPVVQICEVHNISIDEVLTKNYNKLNARYKGSNFSGDNAANRDLKKERTILEA